MATLNAVHIKLILMALIWASSYPLGRVLGSYEVPSVVVFSRLVVAFVVLIIYAKLRGEIVWRLTWREIQIFFLLGFSGFCVHNYLLFKALEHTTASIGAVINGAIPIIIIVMEFLVFRQRISRLGLFGVIFGVLRHGNCGHSRRPISDI